MRITIELDDDLIKQAGEYAGIEDKEVLIRLALRRLVEQRGPVPAKPVPDWKEIFAACDEADWDGFLEDRDQGEYDVREPL